jgi:hypothetical protein
LKKSYMTSVNLLTDLKAHKHELSKFYWLCPKDRC